MGNPVRELYDQQRQAPWLDFIRRNMLDDGGLKRYIEEDGIRGVTANPTIFEKAIGAGEDYDAQIADLVRQGVKRTDLFEHVAVTDIKHAADILRPVYDSSDGSDGFVSIEVSPDKAFQTQATIDEVHRWWDLIDRPNLMVKIPATDEGLPAIEQCVADGVNINITLIFSIEFYERVMEAYVRGLERRIDAGKSVTTSNSVASFFVSRVDTAVDKLLEARISGTKDAGERSTLESLLGKAAVANAKVAYRRFQTVFGSERFAKLRAKGAKVQRPLWASTGTKNSAYSDILYVQELIGPDTVNTMPPQTIDAFRDHGDVRRTIDERYGEAESALNELERIGISMKAVTDQLQREGVEAFSTSFGGIMETTARKAENRRESQRSVRFQLGRYATSVERRVEQLVSEGAAARIWRRDASFWGDQPQRIASVRNRLGWLDVATGMREHVGEVEALARGVRDAGFTSAVLLGMGGSSLAPEVLRRSIKRDVSFPVLHVLDTTDPATIIEVESQIDLARTLFIVSSKSGATIEPNALFAYFFQRVAESLSGDDAGSRFMAITDEGTSLQKAAAKHGFRTVLTNPSDIGGRYSALSYFGLAPAAISGIDVGKLLDSGGEAMTDARSPDSDALKLGATLGELASQGRDKVTFLISPEIASFGLWLEQLIAESTGKDGKGIVPVVDEPPGSPRKYGDDRVFVQIRCEGGYDAEEDAFAGALAAEGFPLIVMDLEDRYGLAGEMFRWEFAVAVAGAVLGVNPFDEPNVQESKDNTMRVLREFSATGRLDSEAPDTGAAIAVDAHGAPESNLVQALSSLFGRIGERDYLAVTAYIQQTSVSDDAFAEIRAAARDALGCATTLGYGPRFLHSTGQLHKGGPPSGVFLQVTASDERDVAVPGLPYTFGELKRAQAMGDFASLAEHGRPVLRVHLSSDIETGLDALRKSVHGALAQPAVSGRR